MWYIQSNNTKRITHEIFKTFLTLLISDGKMARCMLTQKNWRTVPPPPHNEKRKGNKQRMVSTSKMNYSYKIVRYINKLFDMPTGLIHIHTHSMLVIAKTVKAGKCRTIRRDKANKKIKKKFGKVFQQFHCWNVILHVIIGAIVAMWEVGPDA